MPKVGLLKHSSKDVHPYRSWDEVYALADALTELGHLELSQWLRWSCGTGERIEESIVKRECDLVRATGEARVHRAHSNGTEIEMTKYDSAATYYVTDIGRAVIDEIPPDIRRDPHDWQNSPSSSLGTKTAA